MPCSNCGQPGHNRLTCSEPPSKYYTCAGCKQSKHVSEFPFPPDKSNWVLCGVCRKQLPPCCSNCGEAGHNKHACPLPTKEKKGYPGHHCKICGYSGHNQRTCPMRTDEHNVPRRKRQQGCSICGDPKHVSSTCPIPPDGLFYCRDCDKRMPADLFGLRQAHGKSRQDTLCRAHRAERTKRFQRKSAENWLTVKLCAARNRALKHELKFSLTAGQLREQYRIQSGACYYTGMQMTTESGDWCISIDRKDNSFGYTAENIVLCGWLVNDTKRQLNDKQFIALCRMVATHSRQDEEIDGRSSKHLIYPG